MVPLRYMSRRVGHLLPDGIGLGMEIITAGASMPIGESCLQCKRTNPSPIVLMSIMWFICVLLNVLMFLTIINLFHTVESWEV